MCVSAFEPRALLACFSVRVRILSRPNGLYLDFTSHPRAAARRALLIGSDICCCIVSKYSYVDDFFPKKRLARLVRHSFFMGW